MSSGVASREPAAQAHGGVAATQDASCSSNACASSRASWRVRDDHHRNAHRVGNIDRELAELQSASTAASTATVAQARAAPTPWWTTQNAMTMSSVVLFFGIIVIVICAALMRASRPTAEAVLRVFGTVLIITGALFLVVAGYDDKQMASVMGLLGTLAGYLLGKAPASGDGGATERERKPAA